MEENQEPFLEMDDIERTICAFHAEQCIHRLDNRTHVATVDTLLNTTRIRDTVDR